MTKYVFRINHNFAVHPLPRRPSNTDPLQQNNHKGQKMLAHYKNLIQALVIIQRIIISYEYVSQDKAAQVRRLLLYLVRFQKQEGVSTSDPELGDNTVSLSEPLLRP